MPQANSFLSDAGQPTVAGAEPFTCGVTVKAAARPGSAFAVSWTSPAPQFTHTLHDAHNRALLVIIDLRQLTFIDSTGLHAIIDADAQARQTGHRVVLIRGLKRSTARLRSSVSPTG